MPKFYKDTMRTIEINGLEGCPDDAIVMEVRLDCEELDSCIAKYDPSDNTVTLGYLVHDDSPENPMESNDAQGHIYTLSRRRNDIITDNDSEVYSALHVDSYGRPDSGVSLTIDGHTATLAEHAAKVFMDENYGHELTDEWLDEFDHEESDDEDRSIVHRDEIEQDMAQGVFKTSEIDEEIVNLYKQHWKQIVGPYVLPIHYHSERSSTSIGVTSWDGDPDDLPDGVWVADKNATENIDSMNLPKDVHVKYGDTEKKWRVLHDVPGGVNQVFDGPEPAYEFARTLGPADKAWCAEVYAKYVLDEYEKWCDGDVWGCIVVTGKLGQSGSIIPYHEDLNVHGEVWGFIGREYAEQELKERVSQG